MNSDISRNIYIVSTPYHLLLSCNMSNSEDILIITGDMKLSECMSQLMISSFGGKCYGVPSLKFYKENLLEILKFRRNMTQLKKSIANFNIGFIYAFNDVNPVDQWIINNFKHRKDVCIIEEGIGLYRNTIKRNKLMLALFGKLFFGLKYENIDRIGENSNVTSIICSNVSYLSDKQKQKNINLLNKIDFLELSKRLNIKQISNKYWFIGQPLVEDGVLGEREYINGIIKLQDNIRGKSNPIIVVKPHPREKIEKYNLLKNAIIVHEYDIPVELLVNNADEVRIYTYYSSAILSLAKLQNCTSYCMYKLFVENIILPEDIDFIMKQSGVRIITEFSECE